MMRRRPGLAEATGGIDNRAWAAGPLRLALGALILLGAGPLPPGSLYDSRANVLASNTSEAERINEWADWMDVWL